MSIKRIERTYDVDSDDITLTISAGDGGKASHIVELGGEVLISSMLVEELVVGNGQDLIANKEPLKIYTTFSSLGKKTKKTSVRYTFKGGESTKKWRASQNRGEQPISTFYAKVDFE